jgi:hypothetical protein
MKLGMPGVSWHVSVSVLIRNENYTVAAADIPTGLEPLGFEDD